jgi:hypothetical protein
MKNKFFFTAIISVLLLTISCNNSVNINQLLQNETSRQQVFEKIAANHEMMTGFMKVMMNDEHAKMMMKGHDGMKKMMMGDGDMMKMMKDNPDMMHNMMSGMMKDGKMMGHMMEMMNQEGMMSEECMETCMKMMGDKGMDMDKISEDDNHDSHNQ